MNALKIRNKKNFAAGLVYAVSGSAFAIGSLNYSLGSAARMGPAFFPFWLGLLLTILGIGMTISALTRHSVEELLPKFHWNIMAWILLPVVLFGFLLPRLGLVICLLLLVLASSRASHEFRWYGAIVNAVVLLAICVAAFVYGLGLQIPLWPNLSEGH